MELTIKELVQEISVARVSLTEKLQRHNCPYREEQRRGRPTKIYPFLSLSKKIQIQFIERCSLRYLYDLQKLPDLPSALKPLVLGQIGVKHGEIQQQSTQGETNGQSKETPAMEPRNQGGIDPRFRKNGTRIVADHEGSRRSRQHTVLLDRLPEENEMTQRNGEGHGQEDDQAKSSLSQAPAKDHRGGAPRGNDSDRKASSPPEEHGHLAAHRRFVRPHDGDYFRESATPSTPPPVRGVGVSRQSGGGDDQSVFENPKSNLWDNLPQKAREIALWRREQLNQYQEWLGSHSNQKVDHLLSQVEIPAGYGLKALTRRALQLWRKAYNEAGLCGLAPKNGRRGRKVAGIPKERMAELAALYCDPRRPKLMDCLRLSLRRHPLAEGEQEHNRKTYKAGLERAVEPVVIQFFRSKGKWNDSIFPYVKRDKSNLPALWLLNGDHKQCDFLIKYQVLQGKDSITKPKRLVWKSTRPWLTAWQDVRSGAIVGWYLGLKAPSSEEVSLGLRRAILDYGLPAKSGINLQLLMDNGADFRSLPIEMALARLSIDRHFCQVRNAQGKPVERFFKTFDDRFARFEAGYTGEKPENRPPTTAFYEKNPEHLIDLPQAQSRLAKWLEEFHMTPNTTDHQSPLELLTMHRLPTSPVGQRESAWLLPSRLLKIQRGQLELPRREGKPLIYRTKELTYLNGQTVQAFYDPLNPDLIHVYEPLNPDSNQGRWIADCPVQPIAGWLESKDCEAIGHVKSQKKELEADLMEVAKQNAAVLTRLAPAQIIAEQGKLETHFQTPAEKEATKTRQGIAKRVRAGESEFEQWELAMANRIHEQWKQPNSPEESSLELPAVMQGEQAGDSPKKLTLDEMMLKAQNALDERNKSPQKERKRA